MSDLRPPIAPAVRSGAVLALFSLTGCEPGILPSQGFVGKGDTQILIDSGTNDFANSWISWVVSQPHSPTLDLLGSYFPAWMLCAAAGVVTTAVIRQVLAVVGIGEYVVAPLLTYAGLALSATWLIWLLLFGH